VIFLSRKEKYYDFRAIGQAVKTARTKQGMTREQLAERLDVSVRYLANIENSGQIPSMRYFYTLVTMFNISVDEFFYPNAEPVKSTQRKRVDNLLSNLDDSELIIVESVIHGIAQSKKNSEK